MKIVIDIPEEYYKAIMKIPVNQSTADMLIIKNGTPLPKGHGDLKDYDAIKNDYIRKMSVLMSEEERMDLLCTIVDEAEAIIKADKDGQDGR